MSQDSLDNLPWPWLKSPNYLIKEIKKLKMSFRKTWLDYLQPSPPKS